MFQAIILPFRVLPIIKGVFYWLKKSEKHHKIKSVDSTTLLIRLATEKKLSITIRVYLRTIVNINILPYIYNRTLMEKNND